MMNKFTIAFLLFVLCALNAYALGNKEKEKDSPKLTNVEVSGKVRMVGSGPMNSLVITGENREWYIEAEERTQFIDLQQQFVTVKASEYYKDMVFANGQSAGRFYYLKNIVIISPKS
jgi:hypothetical protein